jgi:hypothetical protein
MAVFSIGRVFSREGALVRRRFTNGAGTQCKYVRRGGRRRPVLLGDPKPKGDSMLARRRRREQIGASKGVAGPEDKLIRVNSLISRHLSIDQPRRSCIASRHPFSDGVFFMRYIRLLTLASLLGFAALASIAAWATGPAQSAPVSASSLAAQVAAAPPMEKTRLYCFNRYTGQFLHWGPCGGYRRVYYRPVYHYYRPVYRPYRPVYRRRYYYHRPRWHYY